MQSPLLSIKSAYDRQQYDRLFTYSIRCVSTLIHKSPVSKMLYTETAVDEIVLDG